jgi:hypothetical protein
MTEQTTSQCCLSCHHWQSGCEKNIEGAGTLETCVERVYEPGTDPDEVSQSA